MKSDQSGANGTAVSDRIVIRSFLTDHTVTSEGCTVIPAGILPVTHPLTVSPAMRAEQGDFLTLQLASIR